MSSTLGENKYLSFVQFIIIRYWVWVQMNSHASCAVCCLCSRIIKFKVSHCKSWAKLCCISRNVSHASSQQTHQYLLGSRGPHPRWCWRLGSDAGFQISILIRIHVSRIIVYFDRNLNISTSPDQLPSRDVSLANWDGVTRVREGHGQRRVAGGGGGKSDTVSTSVEVHRCCCCVESEEIFSRRM